MDISTLIEDYGNKLYNYCLKLTKNSYKADDLFQDTWEKVCRNISKYDTNLDFEPWLYHICTNLYRDGYRKAKRWLNIYKDYYTSEDKANILNNYPDNSNLPTDIIEKKEDTKWVRCIIQSLHDKYRLPLFLKEQTMKKIYNKNEYIFHIILLLIISFFMLIIQEVFMIITLKNNKAIPMLLYLYITSYMSFFIIMIITFKDKVIAYFKASQY